jgi:predicted nucleic acid-binding protein
MILKLGEAGAVRLLVSPQVLAEIEGALRRKAPESLGLLALLLDRAGVEVVPSPAPEAVWQSRALTGHQGDAIVLAATQSSGADYFVTLDRAHFLDNPALKSVVPFPIGTPGDFLAWYRERITAP